MAALRKGRIICLMDHELFAALLKSLLPFSVLSFPEEAACRKESEDVLRLFAEKYCYHTALQPCYSREALNEAVKELPEEMIFELQDLLGIRLLLFKADGRTYLAGPFVISVFDEARIRAALIACGLPASYLPSLKLYYSAFPQLSRQNAYHVILGLLRVLLPGVQDYGYRSYTGERPEPEKKPSQYETHFDYETVYRRYELENRFLNMIEAGDTEHVLNAFSRMEISDVNSKRYINAIYFRPEISFAVMRALTRKAAERGGASIMEINEITQRALQTASGAASLQAAGRSLHRMILELTEAVRRHREEDGRFSAPIQKVLSYLRYNFSQEISLEQLAKIAALAPSYLSRQFKQETGRSITETLQKLRCGQAARLLTETQIPIADISAYVGYPDSNYFVKVFRKQYGTAPGAYRKKGLTSGEKVI